MNDRITFYYTGKLNLREQGKSNEDTESDMCDVIKIRLNRKDERRRRMERKPLKRVTYFNDVTHNTFFVSKNNR